MRTRTRRLVDVVLLAGGGGVPVESVSETFKAIFPPTGPAGAYARLRSSVSTRPQYSAPSPPSLAHSPRISRPPSAVMAEGPVDRLIGDLPVADLDMDAVVEDHRVDRIQRPVLRLSEQIQDLTSVGCPPSGRAPIVL